LSLLLLLLLLLLLFRIHHRAAVGSSKHMAACTAKAGMWVSGSHSGSMMNQGMITDFKRMQFGATD
jgi:hypothetical protein